jgi:hypothetical protein
MKNCRFTGALMYGLLILALILLSCGGGGGSGGKSSPFSDVAYGTDGVSDSGRMPVLRVINITPSSPLGINSGTPLQFAATGIYSDNSTQDLTAKMVWTSSDTSIAIVSNEPSSIGLTTAVSKGYCSISATFGGVSGSTIIGVN